MAKRRDYSLNGSETQKAWEKGLVSATWYQTDVPRNRMKKLMKRSDFPAVYHLALWFGLIVLFGSLSYLTWGTLWFYPLFLAYATILTGSSDPRWHEFGHGTACRTQWINTAVYHFASFWLLREPMVWRWSHSRHHTDTIIVGRDPEIITPRPPDVLRLFLTTFNLIGGTKTIWHVFQHAFGKVTEPEKHFVPDGEWPAIFLTARIWIAIWLGVVAWAVAAGSILPLVFFFLPQFVGHWIVLFFGATQHLGLADDVIDHRLNSRTIYMGPVLRFLYLNMNYHLEHHMYPMVPYHALPALHEEIKHDCPDPYPSVWAAHREVFQALWRQLDEPEWWVHRPLPEQPAA